MKTGKCSSLYSLNYPQETARKRNSFPQLLSRNQVLYQFKLDSIQKLRLMTNAVGLVSELKTRYKIILVKSFFSYCWFFSNFEFFFLCLLEKGGNAKSKKRFVNLFSDWQVFHSNIYIYYSFCSPAVFCSLELSLRGDLEMAYIFGLCC